jgi:hypothetical protein
VVESLYGQDLDSGHHGSGFPLPPFRQRLLEAHLAAQTRAAGRPGPALEGLLRARACASWFYVCAQTRKNCESWSCISCALPLDMNL